MQPINAIIISASSDIGAALCSDWCQKGWHVFGTYRNKMGLLENIEKQYAAKFVHCDLLDKKSIYSACDQILQSCPSWDVIVFAAGNLEPIGPFKSVNFDEWENSVQVNLLAQLRILHTLLPHKNENTSLNEPSVMFFAGGGSNGAVLNYSSYAMSKIALTKICEFLDAELGNIRFTIVGPGWVKTKIHTTTLLAGCKAGDNYKKTQEKLESDECTPMEEVIACCNWLITTPSNGVKGRNFSVAYDKWGTKSLEKALENDKDMYKLRRHKNDFIGTT